MSKELLPTPCGWRILIEVSDIQNVTAGGIHIPDMAKSNERNLTSVGKIVRLGNLAYNRPDLGMNDPWAAVGDHVIFGRYAGSRIELDGKEYRLMNDEEILAVIPEEIKAKIKRV